MLIVPSMHRQFLHAREVRQRPDELIAVHSELHKANEVTTYQVMWSTRRGGSSGDPSIKGLFDTAPWTMLHKLQWSSSKKLEFVEQLFRCSYNSTVFSRAVCIELKLFRQKIWSRAKKVERSSHKHALSLWLANLFGIGPDNSLLTKETRSRMENMLSPLLSPRKCTTVPERGHRS